MKTFYRLKVSLLNTKPVIYRRIIVSADTSFFDFHHILQIAMGWQNYHLFEFVINDYIIGIPQGAFGEEDGLSETVIDADTINIGEAITDQKDIIRYVYDFGDNWEHEIIIEEIITEDDSIKAPICTDGDLSCPPENCGGPEGFVQLFAIIKDSQHPEYQNMLDWLDENYNQEGFDIEQVNEQLMALDEYINEWLNNDDEEDDEEEE